MKDNCANLETAVKNTRLVGRRLFPLRYLCMPGTSIKRAHSPASVEPAAKKLPAPPASTMSTSETIYQSSAFLVQRLSEKAKLPTRGSALAAGYDLYACVCNLHHGWLHAWRNHDARRIDATLLDPYLVQCRGQDSPRSRESSHQYRALHFCPRGNLWTYCPP